MLTYQVGVIKRFYVALMLREVMFEKPPTRLLHASYTPLTRLLHASYTPPSRLVHAAYTPLTRLLHASYTPLTRLLHVRIGDVRGGFAAGMREVPRHARHTAGDTLRV
jgi:hypothetical protein